MSNTHVQKTNRRADVWLDVNPHTPDPITILYSAEQDESVEQLFKFLGLANMLSRINAWEGNYELITRK